MLRLTRAVPAPPSAYQILPGSDAGSAQEGSCQSSAALPPRIPSTTAGLGMHSTTSLPETTTTGAPPTMFPGELTFLLPDADSFHLNKRRKASMSKLMRHFGETRIPTEFFLAAPSDTPSTSAGADEKKAAPISPKKVRTKSLDMKSFSALAALDSRPRHPSLHRSRSLGRRSLSAKRSTGNLSSMGEVETTQDRIRRARKMAQILGPEISAELPQLARSLHEPTREEILIPQSEYQPSISSARPSLEDDDPASNAIHTNETPAAPTLSEAAEHRRRTQKLAKFFGVNQHDISVPQPVRARTSSSTSNPSLSPPLAPPLPLQDVEVNIRVAGRRFWGLSPERTKYRSVQTSDAIVIDQLRTLKSG